MEGVDFTSSEAVRREREQLDLNAPWLFTNQFYNKDQKSLDFSKGRASNQVRPILQAFSDSKT